ncbi:MAG: DsbA family protein [Acidimicrobiia bacterium]
MPREIVATFDYRCPFARNGHEAIINALENGADLKVHYQAFSLDQVHVEEGEPPVWEREPSGWGTGTTALLYGIAVRDAFPEKFLEAHVELFAQRHDHGLKLGHEDVLEAAVTRVGLDADEVKAEVWSGRPLKTLAAEHTEAVERWSVFGVPTYCEGEEAVFIRFMERGRGDDLMRALELLQWTRLNEFKRTKIAR